MTSSSEQKQSSFEEAQTRKEDAVDLAARQQILPVVKESSFKLVACKKISKIIAPASPVATHSYSSSQAQSNLHTSIL